MEAECPGLILLPSSLKNGYNYYKLVNFIMKEDECIHQINIVFGTLPVKTFLSMESRQK